MGQRKGKKTGARISKKRRGMGITIKLVAAVVGSAVIAVSVLLAVVYDKMSKTLLEKK